MINLLSLLSLDILTASGNFYDLFIWTIFLMTSSYHSESLVCVLNADLFLKIMPKILLIRMNANRAFGLLFSFYIITIVDYITRLESMQVASAKFATFALCTFQLLYNMRF